MIYQIRADLVVIPLNFYTFQNHQCRENQFENFSDQFLIKKTEIELNSIRQYDFNVLYFKNLELLVISMEKGNAARIMRY